MYSFSREALIEMGRKHWQRHLPAKFAELDQAGTLEQELASAASLTLEAMETDRAEGYSESEAWEMERENFLLLPEEPSEDQLPDNPAYGAIADVNRALREQ